MRTLLIPTLLCLLAASPPSDAEAARRAAWDFTAAVFNGDAEAALAASDLAEAERPYIREAGEFFAAKRAFEAAAVDRFGPGIRPLMNKPTEYKDQILTTQVALGAVEVDGDRASVAADVFPGGGVELRRGDDGRWRVTSFKTLSIAGVMQSPFTDDLRDHARRVRDGEFAHPADLVRSMQVLAEGAGPKLRQARAGAAEAGRAIGLTDREERQEPDDKSVRLREGDVVVQVGDGPVRDAATGRPVTRPGRPAPSNGSATRPGREDALEVARDRGRSAVRALLGEEREKDRRVDAAAVSAAAAARALADAPATRPATRPR